MFWGDVLVVDEDGAILIPEAHLDEVLSAGPEQERLEAWILAEVEQGGALQGRYPRDAGNWKRYQDRQG